MIEDKRQVLSSAAPSLAEGAGGSFTYSQFNPLPLFIQTGDNQGYDHQYILAEFFFLIHDMIFDKPGFFLLKLRRRPVIVFSSHSVHHGNQNGEKTKDSRSI